MCSTEDSRFNYNTSPRNSEMNSMNELSREKCDVCGRGAEEENHHAKKTALFGAVFSDKQ